MKLVSFGKSMYGGWYVNLFVDGQYTGYHFDKLYQVRDYVKKNGLTLDSIHRLDN